MKWVKWTFIALLLLLALPVWRLMDLSAVIWPNPWIFTGLMCLWSAIYVLLPMKLIRPKTQFRLRIIPFLLVITLAYFSGPLSTKATLEPAGSHCGWMTYTGFFYRAKDMVSNAHTDDLEVRNQMCWVRKLIQKVPERIPNDDFDQHIEHLKFRLLKPATKYRAVLPGILFLTGLTITAGMDKENSLHRIKAGHRFATSMELWSKQYSEEISGRVYDWYEWPHSVLIQFEYGLIEKNWDQIQLEFNK